MFRKSMVGAGLAVVAALALTPFALAQGGRGGEGGGGGRETGKGTEGGDREGGKFEWKSHVNEVVIEKPFTEIQGRVNAAVEKVGLVPLAQIDWSRVGRGSERMVPGSARLQGMGGYGDVKPENIRTYLVDTEDCTRMIGKAPEHALFLPGRFVIFEKGGNTVFLATKPASMLKKMEGKLDPKDYEKHETHARQLEEKLNQIANELRSGR
jgi:uncharacterized protein (DUF302 family)